MQHQILFRISMWDMSILSHVFWSWALLASYFSLTFQWDKPLMMPKRLPANKQEGRKCSLSILTVSITLACLLGGTSFSTCCVPWALRRLDGQSMGWTCVLPHNGLSVLTSFWFYHSLSRFLFFSALLSVTHSLMVADSVSSWREQKDKEINKRSKRL